MSWKTSENILWCKCLGQCPHACPWSEKTCGALQTRKPFKNHLQNMENHRFPSKINGFSLISCSELVQRSRHAYRGACRPLGRGLPRPLGQWDLRRADVPQWCSGAHQSMRIFLFKKSKKLWKSGVPEIVSTGGLKLKLLGPSSESSVKTPNGIWVCDRCRSTSVNLRSFAYKQTNASFLESTVLD